MTTVMVHPEGGILLTALHRRTTAHRLRRVGVPAAIIMLLPVKTAGVATAHPATQVVIMVHGAVTRNHRNLLIMRHSVIFSNRNLASSNHNQPTVPPSGPLVHPVHHRVVVATQVVAGAGEVPEGPVKI
jgi:hypothetical protein